METQGRDRAESGSRWAEFHENLAYCMFSLVRKQNFGSKSNSGSENFVSFRILGHKKKMNISKFDFGPGSPKNRFLRFFRKFLREKSRNTGISSETTIPGISSETTETWESAVIPLRSTRNWPLLKIRRVTELSSHSRFPYSRFFS